MDNLAAYGIQRIRDNLTKHNINASGRTAASLKGEDYGFCVLIYSDGSGAPFNTTQYGREGGAVPYGFVGIIKQWIIDKGLAVKPVPYKRKPSARWQPKYTEEERSLNIAAGAIAAKIEDQGTERHAKPTTDIYTPVQEEVLELFKERTLEAIIRAYLE